MANPHQLEPSGRIAVPARLLGKAVHDVLLCCEQDHIRSGFTRCAQIAVSIDGPTMKSGVSQKLGENLRWHIFDMHPNIAQDRLGYFLRKGTQIR